MFIQIETESDVPIYLQLVHQLIESVIRGELKPGDTLPSVRMFAADLGVNMHTVNKAYHELEAKKIIRIVPKSGVIIHTEAVRQANETDLNRLQHSFRPLIAEALVLGLKEDELSNLVMKLINSIKEGTS
ncbi:GntR family transcriptional regulator [bacterium LRH843]|nr:GntR family transcriptional regulator [bacterium LRH843]